MPAALTPDQRPAPFDGQGGRGGTPEVTVVVPTRNRLAMLREAVASVQAQEGCRWEAVVVDDASRDGTASWLASLGDERFRTARLAARAERSAARNHGLAQARGRAVLFLDDDDRLAPGALATLLEALDRHPQAVAAIGAKVAFDDEGQRRRVPHPRRASVRPVLDDVIAGAMFVSGQVLLRTAEVREAGGWNDEFVGPEDQDLWLRVPGARPAALVPSVVLEQRSRFGARYPHADAAEREIRRRYVSSLAGEDRRRAQRLVRTRDEVRSATWAFERDDFRAAAGHLARALAATPSVVRSPVLGPPLLLSLAKAAAAALLPGRGGSWAHLAVRRARSALGRNPLEPGIRPIGRRRR